MSNDDELDRLLREVDASLSGGAAASASSSTPATGKAPVPATRPTGDPAPRGRAGSALRTGVVSGAVCGVAVGASTFVLSWLPLIDNPVSSGLGAFVGAFLTGTVLSFRRGSSG